jgi:hypothetical protein
MRQSILILVAGAVAIGVYLAVRPGEKVGSATDRPSAKSTVISLETRGGGGRRPIGVSMPDSGVSANSVDAASNAGELEQTDEDAEEFPSKVFETGTPDLVSESRIIPILDRAFGRKDSLPSSDYYRVQCRSSVCRVSSSIDGWQSRLSDDPDGVFHAVEITSKDTFLQFEPNESAARTSEHSVKVRNFLDSVLRALKDAKGLKQCKVDNPLPTGKLELVIAVEPSTRRLTVVSRGALANEASGRCILSVVESAVQPLAIPPDLAVVPTLPLTVTVP